MVERLVDSYMQAYMLSYNMSELTVSQVTIVSKRTPLFADLQQEYVAPVVRRVLATPSTGSSFSATAGRYGVSLRMATLVRRPRPRPY